MSSNIPNVFMFSSSCRRLENKNKGPKLRDKSELQILNSKFDELYIGFSPLGSTNLHILSNHLFDFRKKLPKGLGAKKFVHACIFLKNNGFEDGALVEYGAYVKGDDEYPYEVFYLKDNGLRYTQMSFSKFKEIMDKENEPINKSNNEIKNIPYIKCKINSLNYLYQLLFRTIFGELFHKNPELSLKKILYEEEYKEKYCAEAYKLLNNNCQCFVAKLIEASFSTIDKYYFGNENREYLPFLSDSKIDYETLSYMIPTNIAEALKSNEKKIEERILNGESNIVEDNVDLYNQLDIVHYLNVMERVFNSK